MGIFDFLHTPFPRPKKIRKVFFWIMTAGIVGSFFLILLNPFGIKSENAAWYVYLIIFGFGIVFMVSILIMEVLIPMLFPELFKKWTLGKALIWYSVLLLFISINIFLYKSYWEDFDDFTWQGFWLILKRTLVICFVICFLTLGIWKYLNKEKLSLLTLNENYLVTTENGKSITLNLNEILYIKSDDNYVDIYYESNGIKKRITLRSSLKNLASQLINPISPILRCHRRYLINSKFFEIEKLSSRSAILILKKYEEKIPVSQNYVRQIKQQLSLRP